jgi:hypothetical protein
MEVKVVETNHPYAPKYELKEYISFPGAAALFLHFSSQSTTSLRDTLKLYRDEDARIPVNSETFSGRFPRHRLVVTGESVLFLFQVFFCSIVKLHHL